MRLYCLLAQVVLLVGQALMLTVKCPGQLEGTWGAHSAALPQELPRRDAVLLSGQMEGWRAHHPIDPSGLCMGGGGGALKACGGVVGGGRHAVVGSSPVNSLVCCGMAWLPLILRGVRLRWLVHGGFYMIAANIPC